MKVQMYLLIICSEVNILLTNYIYLLSACFCASFDIKIFSIALLGHLPEAKNYPPHEIFDVLIQVFADYLFGGEYFVNKLYIFVISMLLCIF